MRLSTVGPYAGAIVATIKRDATIFFSYRMRLFSQVLGMLFTITTFYYVAKLVRPGTVGPQGRYFAFVVIGVVATAVLTSALNSAQIIRAELMAGNFERVLISPLGPVWGVVAVAAFPILYATVFSGAMLGLAAILYGIPVAAGGIVPALGIAVVGALAMGCIGMLFVAGLLAFKSAMGATWVVAGLSLLGGAYFPLRLFPGWLRWTSDVQPFTPTLDLLRHALLGTPTHHSVVIDMVTLVGFTAVLMPLCVGALALAIWLSRRRGTIMEY
jgi:ABC-2 type transport system permease protein